MKRTIQFLSIFVVIALALAACNTALPTVSSGEPTVDNTLPQTAAPTEIAQAPQAGQPAAASAAPSSALLTAFQGTMEEIYQNVGPSVVNIQVVEQATNTGGGISPFFPFFNNPQGQQPQVQQALGSGFVWDTAGHIVTNNHVVDSATQVSVTFQDGKSYPAKVIGTDVNSDLAVIQVDAAAAELNPVKMASSSQVKVGQLAVAIGNPFGLSGTMTMGIISALGRSLPVGSSSQQAAGPTYTIPDVIQTDAPINPGNSGGVLVNTQGEVIGVTAAIESSTNSSAGIGFVIPSDIVARVVPSLIQDGKYSYSWLGIEGTTLNADLIKAMKLPAGQTGALVISVTSGGPADKAGILGGTRQVDLNGSPVAVGGDLIVSIDGQPVTGFDDVSAYLVTNTQPGQTIKLGILRDGKQMTVDVTLGERPTSQSQAGQSQSNNVSGTAWLGVGGVTVNTAIANQMKLPANVRGVLIEQVQTGSPADQAGLQAGDRTVTLSGQRVTVGGDVIIGIDGQAINTVNQLRQALAQFNPGDDITVTVVRGGQQLDVQITLGESPS